MQLASSRVDDASEALYAATENIKDLGLGLRRADDSEIQEKLAGMAFQLGYEGEVILNQNAISQGLYFFPRYLNESLMEYPEYADTRDPGTRQEPRAMRSTPQELESRQLLQTLLPSLKLLLPSSPAPKELVRGPARAASPSPLYATSLLSRSRTTTPPKTTTRKMTRATHPRISRRRATRRKMNLMQTKMEI